MQILAHRGLWNQNAEKNTSIAFKKEFAFCRGLALKSSSTSAGGGGRN